VAKILLEQLLERQHLAKTRADRLANLGRGRTGQFCMGRHVPRRDSVELIRLSAVLDWNGDPGRLLDVVDDDDAV
jgi:hypothetical protein